MSDVQFEEGNFQGRFAPVSSQPPTLVKFVLKTGLVKDDKQANYVLIGIAVVAVISTFFVIKSNFGGSQPSGNFVPPGSFPEPGLGTQQ